MKNTAARSPQMYARIGGILYLFIILAALFGEAFVRGNLIARDPDLTAANILSSETLFRFGLAVEMLTCVCDVALAMILYVLLRPVSKNLALLAAFFRLVFVAIYGAAKLFEIAALSLLDHPDYLKDFSAKQLHALVDVSLSVHGYGYGVSLLFFGFCSVIFGYLIYVSAYLPRIIGALLAIAGVGYVVYSLLQIVAPEFTDRVLFPWLLLPGFIAEVGLTLWLLVKGVNLAKWNQIMSSRAVP